MAGACAISWAFFVLAPAHDAFGASSTGTASATLERTGCVGEGSCTSSPSSTAAAEAAAAYNATKAAEAKDDAVSFQGIAEGAPDQTSADTAAGNAEAAAVRAAEYERLASIEADIAGTTAAQASAAAAAASLTTAEAAATAARTAATNFVAPTPPPPPTETVANDTGTSSALPTTEGGGVTDPTESVEVAGESTFRPAPTAEAPPPVSAAPTNAATSEAQAETRLPSDTRTVGNLLGGASTVGVAGSPNQTFAVSLPGTTVYSGGGGSVVTIDSFVHNAGFTPALNSAGSGTFVMGAKLGGASGAAPAGAATTATTGAQGDGASGGTGEGAGEAAAGGTAAGGDTGGSGDASTPDGGANAPYTGPVIAASPFINITISYN